LSWQGYFNEIKDISGSSTAVIAASENALFSKNTLDNQIKTTTTVDGFLGKPLVRSIIAPKKRWLVTKTAY
jgi:capsular polysaccharide biosynthesis protein